jgi:hypothetical protein
MKKFQKLAKIYLEHNPIYKLGKIRNKYLILEIMSYACVQKKHYFKEDCIECQCGRTIWKISRSMRVLIIKNYYCYQHIILGKDLKGIKGIPGFDRKVETRFCIELKFQN